MKTKKKEKENLLLGSKTFTQKHTPFHIKILFLHSSKTTQNIYHWKWTKRIKKLRMMKWTQWTRKNQKWSSPHKGFSYPFRFSHIILIYSIRLNKANKHTNLIFYFSQISLGWLVNKRTTYVPNYLIIFIPLINMRW